MTDEKVQHQADTPKLESVDYNDRIKAVIADWLQYELDARRSENTPTITDEKIAELKQRRNLGEKVVRNAMLTAGAILIFLVLEIILNSSGFIMVSDLPQVVLISASFISCAIIFGVLIKGLFYKPKDEPDSSPIKEATDILKHLRGDE